MKFYVKHDGRGNITEATTEPRDGWIEVPDGILAHPGSAYVHGGQVVAYAADDASLKNTWPGAGFEWDNDSMSWVDARTLGEVKAQRWAQIKAQRDAVEFGGFTWSGDEFDSDAESQARIMGAVQMALIAAQAEQPFAIDWTLADNTVRSMSAADIVSAGLALGEHVAAAHGIARTLRAAIDACTTAAEVEAVAWPS